MSIDALIWMDGWMDGWVTWTMNQAYQLVRFVACCVRFWGWWFDWLIEWLAVCVLDVCDCFAHLFIASLRLVDSVSLIGWLIHYPIDWSINGLQTVDWLTYSSFQSLVDSSTTINDWLIDLSPIDGLTYRQAASANVRQRTTFHLTLARLIFTTSDDMVPMFEAFMEPLLNVLQQLGAAATFRQVRLLSIVYYDVQSIWFQGKWLLSPTRTCRRHIQYIHGRDADRSPLNDNKTTNPNNRTNTQRVL